MSKTIINHLEQFVNTHFNKYYKFRNKRLFKGQKKSILKNFNLDLYVMTYELNKRIPQHADKQIKNLGLRKGLDYMQFDCLSKHIHQIAKREIMNLDVNEVIEHRQRLEKEGKTHSYVIENFGSWRNYLIELNKISLKKAFIPYEISIEVSELVKSKYENDWLKYFYDVQQYFDTITLTEFKLLENTNTKYLVSMQNKSGRATNSKKRKLLHHSSSLLKLVGFDRATYISNSQFNIYKRGVVKQQNFFKSMQLMDKNGFTIDLSKVCKTQKQYVAEKVNMIRTQELFALDKGFTWSFITLTSEGDFHPFPKFKGKDWEYNGVSASESAKKLSKDWNNIRALMKNRGLLPGEHYHGSSTSECHNDSLRHIHLILFHHINDLGAIRDAFFTAKPNLKERVLLCEQEQQEIDKLLFYGKITQEEHKEKSKKIRNPWRMCDVSQLQDKTKLGAVTYCFKYIMKSCATFDLDFDPFAEHDKETIAVLKNNAFRNAIGIRGFNFFGFDSCLSKYRFLARKVWRLKEGQSLEGVSVRLQEILKANDLYSFVKEGFHKIIKNKYVTNGSGNKVLIGVEIDNVQHLKNFFVMSRKSVLTELKKFDFIEDRDAENQITDWYEDQNNEGIYLNRYQEQTAYKVIAKNKEKETLSGSILVNHNYSSKERKAKKQKNHSIKKWKNNNFKYIYKRFYKFVDLSKDFIPKNLVLCNNY